MFLHTANGLQLCEGREFIFCSTTNWLSFNKDNLLNLYSSTLLLQKLMLAECSYSRVQKSEAFRKLFPVFVGSSVNLTEKMLSGNL